MRAAGWAVIAGMLLSVRLQSQPQQLCGRVVSIRCSRLSRIATFTVRTDDNAQFEVMIPAEHRAAFGDDIETTYEFRNICVTPRAVQDRKAVVHAPRDLGGARDHALARLSNCRWRDGHVFDPTRRGGSPGIGE